MLPEVSASLFSPVDSINTPLILAPADDLPKKFLERVERNIVRTFQCCVNDLLRGQQSDIQRGCEHRMEQKGFIAVDRV